MAFDPSRLYSSLMNTGLQQSNNPLYQVIRNLIEVVTSMNNQINTPKPIPLTGVKIYWVSDTNGGVTNRKLTFTDGILTSET